jgi:hypothetical protein
MAPAALYIGGLPLVSVPVRAFSQTNEAQFYVSMSREMGDTRFY